MNRFVQVAVAATLLSSPALAQEVDGFGPLVSAEELAGLLDTAAPLVLDIRGDAYAEGHVEGAVSAPYGLFRGPAENPGQVPSDDALTQVLRDLGVTADRPVVITHQGRDETDFGAAARVYWTLKSSGVSDLAILNGGVGAWQAAGNALSTEPVDPEESAITVSFSDQWLATQDDVLQVVEGDAQATLVDARPESFWAGEDAHPAAARPGTLPQSEYFTHSNWFSDDPTLIDAVAARALAEEGGFADDDTLISFCNTGHWAATNWFALSELAGLDDVKLYPESMVGWSHAGLPMQNTPGVIENLWNQITNAL
ncbi:sulfurtransferase [Limimaricola hongkongensis]|uniref:Rhodanese-related sulfurtransferase n=1 Tax=Limimaricola hongkongensis DSM 17492 TaxID=1122180 RepID=A0A017H928_9RHOB|nr:rhodanese-like domain-containing protein [Limimaricola hongkongensis]EYD70881.1 Rhodanese-related sulfurtransferase [Limimaricola hongkongensis DSM 17492]